MPPQLIAKSRTRLSEVIRGTGVRLGRRWPWPAPPRLAWVLLAGCLVAAVGAALTLREIVKTDASAATARAPDLEVLVVFAVGVVVGLLGFAVVSLLARTGARSKGQLSAILENSTAAIFIRDRDQRYTLTNRAFEEMFGLEPGVASGRTAREVLPAGVAEEVLLYDRRVLAGETVAEERLIPGDGGDRLVAVLRFPLVDAGGAAYAVCGIATDITERRQIEDQLQHLSDHDPLTGMYNRARLIGELDRQLRYAAQSGRSGAVLTLDLDRFKLTNDTAGHATGDAILSAVAEVLQARTRRTDTVARLGSDEFAVLLPEATEDEASSLALDLRALLCERPISPPITASFGITVFAGNAQITADEVLACADLALFAAKEHGGDQARVYTGETSTGMTWAQRIRTALDHDRFVLYGQPIVDLRTAQVSHHEVLIRMLSDAGEIIPPVAFLPTAERFGLIQEIDRWVTGQALRLATAEVGVAINLSGFSIGEPAIIAAVREALRDGVDPAKVIFEITETAAMTNFQTAQRFAGTLDDLGCNLALDDFGTGFGSFSYLKHVPARYLKIDLEFVRELATSPTDRRIVEAIVHVAHCFDKLTVAEGVEDAETLEILKAIGVDFAQGFYLGRPERLSPPTAFERELGRPHLRGRKLGV
jgi:diguanylate cyclase (GGDEF)-like protein/PAS domain S-box-containing protein